MCVLLDVVCVVVCIMFVVSGTYRPSRSRGLSWKTPAIFRSTWSIYVDENQDPLTLCFLFWLRCLSNLAYILFFTIFIINYMVGLHFSFTFLYSFVYHKFFILCFFVFNSLGTMNTFILFMEYFSCKIRIFNYEI